jgi:hypothetical protein
MMDQKDPPYAFAGLRPPLAEVGPMNTPATLHFSQNSSFRDFRNFQL